MFPLEKGGSGGHKEQAGGGAPKDPSGGAGPSAGPAPAGGGPAPAPPARAAALPAGWHTKLAQGRWDELFTAYVEPHRDDICRVMFRATGQWDDAEDLTQEALVRVYMTMDHIRANPGGFLLAVALNVFRGRLRWLRRHPAVSLDAPAAGYPDGWSLAGSIPDPSILEPDEAEQMRLAMLDALRQFIESLPAEDRELLRRIYEQDLTHAEVAAALGCPTANAVSKRVSRLKAQAREALGRLDTRWERDAL